MYETCDTYGKGLKIESWKLGPEILNVRLEWLRYVIFIDFFFPYVWLVLRGSDWNSCSLNL